MSKIASIKFNDTEDYTYMTVLQIEGVYSPKRIQADTLPEGFYRYELSRGHNTRFSAVQESHASIYAGDFISTEKLSLGETGRCVLKEADWSLHLDQPFDFEAFWGHKISFEKLVSNAEYKHELLMGKDPNARDHRSGEPIQDTQEIK